MRIGIVNDMALACEALRRVVESSPGLRVAWIARDGGEAVDRTRTDRPDLILMDLIMPRTDGVEATRQIMAECPCPIVVVTSSVSGNIALVYEAMGHGAVDAVDTPSLGPGGQVEGAANLLQKIATIRKLTGLDSSLRLPRHTPHVGKAASSWTDVRATGWGQGSRQTSPRPESGPPQSKLVLIGASTGGPTALVRVLEDLPAGLPVSVVIVQHVDRAFAGGLVQWLGAHARMPVQLAEAGQRATVGKILVAHTNDHLAFERDGRLTYTPEPRDQSYRPSVDVLFQSALDAGLPPGVAVVLTGMGRDGALGLAALRSRGWHTIAQDRASSIVYGMPKAAAEIGAAVEILPLNEIGRAVTRVVKSSIV
jgi:two-component system response regulator WspF